MKKGLAVELSATCAWLLGLMLVVGVSPLCTASGDGLPMAEIPDGPGVPPWQMLFGLVLGESSEAELRSRIPDVRRTGTDRYTRGAVYEVSGKALPEPGFSRAVFIFGDGRLVAVRLYFRTGMFGKRFREIVQWLSKQGYETVFLMDMPGARNAYKKSRDQVQMQVFGHVYQLAKVAVRVSEGLSFEGEVVYETPAYVVAVQKSIGDEQRAAVKGGGKVPPAQVLFGLVLGESGEAELRWRIPGARRSGTDRYTGGAVYEVFGKDLPEPGFTRAEFVFGEGRLVAARLYFRTGVFGRRFREIVQRLSMLYELQYLRDRIIAGRSAHLKSREMIWVEVSDEFEFMPKVEVRVNERHASFEGKIVFHTFAYHKAVKEFSALEQQRAIERLIREASKVKPPWSR